MRATRRLVVLFLASLLFLISPPVFASDADPPPASGPPPAGTTTWLLAAGLLLLAGISGGLLFVNVRLRKTNTRSAEALRALESIHSAIPDILYTIDPGGRIVRWNTAAEAVSGLPPEKIGGLPALSFIVEEDRPAIAEALGAVLEKGEAQAEGRLIGVGGREIPYHWKAVSLRDERGTVVGITGVGRDVSERRASEEEQRKLVALIENSADLFGISTLDGKILYLNRAGQELVGLDGIDEVRNKTIEDFSMPHLRDKMREVSRILTASGRWKGEARIRNFKTGKGIPIELNSFVIKDARTGEPLYLANVSRDITERKRMEEELLKVQKLESIGLLAGGIAHDFNNLLTAILGNILLAKAAAREGDPARAVLEEAEKASFQAKDLTRQLLTFARGGEPVKRTISVERVVRESAVFALRGTRSRCEFSFIDGLSPVEADRGQISQVVHNVVLNADQSMGEGGVIRVSGEHVRIEPGEVPPLAAGPYVRISVTDSGVGIPPENLAKIFDPYFTTKKGGSGLGLATAYSILRKHGGHVTVESRVKEGTTFRIYLPASAGSIPAGEKAPDRVPDGKGRILVMDDESMVRDVAKRILEVLGYEVTGTGDGADAVALYREALDAGRPYDAVIMDLTVPGGMGGVEAVRKLREIDRNVKAIVSSGYSIDPVMAEYERYGFSAVVEKPYNMNQLGLALRTVIRAGR